MTEPIEDVSSLPGKKISDQEEVEIGEVKDVYATDDGFPMWVAVETRAGIGDKRTVFVPLARLKDEDGELRVPYSKSHILESPEVDVDDHISEECDQTLRGFYAIGVADQELWTDNKSYATLVPDEPGSAKRAENADELDTPDADKRSEETMERIKNPGSSEMRDVSADDVAAESGTAATGDKKGDQRESGPEGKGDSEGKRDQEGTRDQEGEGRED